jgi:hypothetical protein
MRATNPETLSSTLLRALVERLYLAGHSRYYGYSY